MAASARVRARGNESRHEDTSSGDELEDDHYDLSPHSWTVPFLKTAAIQLKLLRPRSLAWAILLDALPPPNNDLISILGQHRLNYEQLRDTFTKDPRAVVGDDPLSQKDESVWKQHFCDNELRALILQDVIRTFPDDAYFRQKDVQDLMVRILFVWARSHSTVGYRQGMHEVLGPLLFELHTDRKYASSVLSKTLQEVLQKEYLEHDSYMLFTAVMKGLEKFYTTGDSVPTACGRLPISMTLHNPNEVVRYLENIRAEHLVPIDPELSAHLANCNITLELFGIRWLRLLFGREFPHTEISNLWSFLFAEGPSLPHVHYVLIATLVSMRNTLLDPDPGVVLSALMRPAGLNVGHVVAFALHLARPLVYPRPPTPPPPAPQPNKTAAHDRWQQPPQLEERGVVGSARGDGEECDEGLAEGADVARELATLALLRAQLPPAAAALAHALPARPPTDIAHPLSQILQLSALLQCRNHALVDVETALEAAEGQSPNKSGKRQLVPVNMSSESSRFLSHARPQLRQSKRQVKEVQLKVFHRAECAASESELPCLDPLRLRTE